MTHSRQRRKSEIRCKISVSLDSLISKTPKYTEKGSYLGGHIENVITFANYVSIRFVDPKNLCLDTNFIGLGQLV